MQVIEHYIVPSRPFVPVPTQYHAEVAVSPVQQAELPQWVQWTLIGVLGTMALAILFVMFLLILDLERK